MLCALLNSCTAAAHHLHQIQEMTRMVISLVAPGDRMGWRQFKVRSGYTWANTLLLATVSDQVQLRAAAAATLCNCHQIQEMTRMVISLVAAGDYISWRQSQVRRGYTWANTLLLARVSDQAQLQLQLCATVSTDITLTPMSRNDTDGDFAGGTR